MQRIAVKTDHGYTYEYRLYKNGLYDPEATDKFNQLQKKAEMDQAKDFFKEVVGINDYIRMVDGIDPLTGKKITHNEQAVSSLMFLLTVVSEATALKILKNMKNGKKILKDVELSQLKTPDKMVEGKVGKKVSGADDIFKKTPEIEKHLKYTDSSVPRKRGIGGAHNSEEFFKNDVKVIKQTSTDVPGVSVVEYQIPELYAKGLPTGNYKKTIFKKSIYDPSIIPDDEYIKRGLEAANDAIKNNNGSMPREWVGKDSSGKSWRGFLKMVKSIPFSQIN
ncbi:pre-toxin TG domain-containing protein [Listeria aquatica]|uniref:pre-toxin TG domain-containing protein n=1 Tax=Listeria aquatica TaxID=1494960 RepID=UPI0031F587E7